MYWIIGGLIYCYFIAAFLLACGDGNRYDEWLEEAVERIMQQKHAHNQSIPTAVFLCDRPRGRKI